MADFRVTDRRHSARASGLVVGGTVAQARQAAAEDALRRGREGTAPPDPVQARAMRLQRVAYGGGSGATLATQRPRDPLFYLREGATPYGDLKKEEDLRRIRAICRAIYATNPVIASAIDIFSRWPLTGMEFVGKDKALNEFYTELMFNQLDYEDYLVDVGRERWLVGEAWPLGSFSEDLGVWEADELLDADDVFVQKTHFVREPHFSIRLPESLRAILASGQPAAEYQALVADYPELRHFTSEDSRMPVSGVLLKQLRFKGDPFNPRGVPILTRAFRAVIQEEMLNSAQDAIADRLYTPLVLARIGASAQDLGTEVPWIPTADQISAFEDALDTALAADFRVLTTHFATDMTSVFGREAMPNFDADFDRVTERQLQVFGLSKTMLSGAGSGETYAADALNRDLITMLLTTHQREISKFVRDRMLVVAEAQEHFDYEERGGRRYPVMEEILVVDEETGERRVVEQPRLLVPEIKFRAMNMADDETSRSFYEALREAGVPISMKTRLVNVPVDLDEEIEASRDEQVRLAVEAQETRLETYKALKAKNLPVPKDLREDFDPKPLQARERAASEPTRVPQLGVDDPAPTALAPVPEEMDVPPGQPVERARRRRAPGQDDQIAEVIPMRNRVMDRHRDRPVESDEQRARMPKPAVKVQTPDGEQEVEGARLIVGPAHVGTRRHSRLTRDTPLPEEPTGS